MKTYSLLISCRNACAAALLVFAITNNNLLAQAPDTSYMFQKTIGGNPHDYLYDMHKTTDGAYILAGETRSFIVGPTNNDFAYVIKMGKNGNTLWTTSYGDTTGSSGVQYINDIFPTSDGGYIANGGYNRNPNPSIGGEITRMDANGNVLWSKNCTPVTDPYPVIQTGDGNYVCGGYALGIGAGGEEGFLMKLDTNGDTIWSRTYGGTGNDWFYHILQTRDGGYLAAGFTTSFGQGGKDIYLVKTDPNGNLMWSKTYGTAGNNEIAFGHSVAPTADGGYIITGQGNESEVCCATLGGPTGVFLLKIDSVGNMMWAKYYYGEYGHAVKVLPNGGFIIAGSNSDSSSGSISQSVELMETDSAGNVLWNNNYGYPSGDQQGLAFETAYDGGFVMGGYTTVMEGINGNRHDYILKTDVNGNAGGCNQSSASTTSSAAPFIVSNAATIVHSGINTVAYPYVVLHGTTDTSLCSAILPYIYSVTGGGSYCAGGSGVAIGLSGSQTGVNYQLMNGSATAGSPVAGTGSAISFGLITTAATYSVTATFSSGTGTVNMLGGALVSINPLPGAGTITGIATLSAGGTTNLTDVTTGGVWSSASTGIATVNSAGTVTGVATGTTIISYVVTNICGSASATRLITVIPDTSYMFQKTYGGSQFDYAYDLHMTLDGGYVFGGVTYSYTAAANPFVYILKTDYKGDTLWTTTFGDTAAMGCQQYINDISILNDGGYVANGGNHVCSDPSLGGEITRFDAAGNVLWSKHCSPFADPYPVIQASDGSYVSGGYVQGIGAGARDAFLMKLDASGDTIWSRTYGGARDDWFYHIVQTADGGFLAAGYTYSFGQGSQDIYLVKTDANGNLMWSKTYGTADGEAAYGHCLQSTIDGGYILAGYGDTSNANLATGMFLLKIDSSGNMNWAKYYTGEYGHGVKQTPDGGYILCGTGNYGTSSDDAVLVKTDASGNIVWSKSYGGSGFETGWMLELANDGGYVTGGYSTSFGAGSADVYLVKTDVDGNSGGCNEHNPGVTASNASFIEANAGTQVFAGPSTVPYIYFISHGAQVGTQCAAALPLLFSVTGGGTYCSGGSGVAIGLSGSQTGVNYQLMNGSSMVGSPVSGTGSAITFSMVTGAGTYSVVASFASATGTVNMQGSATVVVNICGGTINGVMTVCSGSTTTLTDATGGGTWSSGNTGIATVGSSSGVVGGVSAGTALISYTVSGSTTTATVTVNPLPNAGSITGASVVCAGSNITLIDATSGGEWSTANGNATVGSTGTVTGVSTGTDVISYTVTNGCGSVSATATITINPLPNAGNITGTAIVCQGATTNLTDAVTGGVWSSGATGIATVGSTGIVTGIAAGTATISYTVTNGCGNVSATTIVTVNMTSAGTITGPSSVNTGANITLTDAVVGGAWSASNSNATVLGGIVTGVAGGTVVISYAVTGSCGTAIVTKLITVTVSSLPGITGVASMCTGATTSLSDVVTGGTWSSSNVAIATVGAATGIVSGVAAGTANIMYTLGGVSATITVTVNPSPLPIQGASSECAGITISLSDVSAGGTWSSSNTNATIDGSGNITGVTAGTSTTTYTLGNGCFTTYPNTVLPDPGAITGTAIVCVGGTAMLTDTTSGSLSWTSSNTSVATAINSGQVTGVATGTAVVTYKITSGCYATTTVTVTNTAAPVSGNSAVCAGSFITLSDVSGAGTWTSSNTAIATVGSGSGIVTGVAAGTATVTYMPGTGGCKATAIITVNAAAAISGNTNICTGATTTLSDASVGGTWLSGNTGIATVGLSSGIVTGISTGSVSITYTFVSGCTRAVTVNVSGSISTISGPGAVCASSITTLSDATTGGVWSLSSSLVASIGSATGIVTASGTYAGTTTVSYTASGCVATQVLTVNPNPTPIQGSSSECAGVTITLTDATAGGAWSGAGDVAVAGSGTAGTVTGGASAGTGTITYTIATGCFTTYPNTVYANPAPITGTFVVCTGATTYLTDATGGGVSWTSSNTAVATNVGSTVTGVAVGTATITYKILPGNCIAIRAVTVNASPAVSAISGPASISHATPATLSDATAGGIWSSNHVAVIALGGSTGSPVTATAVATSGTATISYAVTSGAGCTTTVIKVISATPAPPPHGGTPGTATLFAGATVNLGDNMGGLWSSSNYNIATVDGNGMVTGIAPGFANITHVTTNEQGDASTNVTTVEVTSLPINISIVPNPNKGTFTVNGTTGSTQDEEVVLEITDVLGQVIYKNKATAQSGRLNETVILNNVLVNGMYVLSIQCNEGSKVVHFVMER